MEDTVRNETDAAAAAVVGARPRQPYSTVGITSLMGAASTDSADNNNNHGGSGIVGIRARSHEEEDGEDHHEQEDEHGDDGSSMSRPTSPQESILATHDILGIIQGDDKEQEALLPPSLRDQDQQQHQQSSATAPQSPGDGSSLRNSLLRGRSSHRDNTNDVPTTSPGSLDEYYSCDDEEDDVASQDGIILEPSMEEENTEMKASNYDYDVNWDMVGHRRLEKHQQEEEQEDALNQSTCSSLAEAAAATAMLATAAAPETTQEEEATTHGTNVAAAVKQQQHHDDDDDDDPLQQLVPLGRRTRSSPQPRMYSRTARPSRKPSYYYNYRQYSQEQDDDDQDDDDQDDENENDNDGLMADVDLTTASQQQQQQDRPDHGDHPPPEVRAFDDFVNRTTTTPMIVSPSSLETESIHTTATSSSSSSGGSSSIHQRRGRRRPLSWSSSAVASSISSTSAVRPRRPRSASLNTNQPQQHQHQPSSLEQPPASTISSSNNNNSGRRLRASLDSGMASLRRWIISRSAATGGTPRSSRAARRWQREHNHVASNNNDTTSLQILGEEDLFALSNAGIDPRRQMTTHYDDSFHQHHSFRTSSLLYPPSIMEEGEESDSSGGYARQRALSEPDGRMRLRNFWFPRSASDYTPRGFPRDATETNSSEVTAAAAAGSTNPTQLSSAALSSSLFHSPQVEMTEISSTDQASSGVGDGNNAAAGASDTAGTTVGDGGGTITETGTAEDNNAADEDDTTVDPDPNREARTRWIRINRRFQLIITMVALVFSLLLFAILVCWVVLTSAYVISIDKSCDVPLKTYFWLATLQLIMDVFRADIMRFVFRWDANSNQRIPARVIIYNIAYLIYAILVLRLGITSVFATDDNSTCSETAPELFQASTVFVTLSIAAWSTIVLGYLVPFCFVATLLTWNGYTPASDINRDPNMVATPGFGGVFPSAYTINAGAPPGCIDQLRVVMLEEFPDDYPQECCICMGDFCPGEVIVATECEHVFHKRCCQEWLRQARTCPVCRTDIPSSIGSAASGDNDSQADEEEGQQQQQQQQHGVNRRLGQAFGPSGRPFGRDEFHQEVVGLLRILRQHEERLRQRNNNANDIDPVDTANEEDMRTADEEASTRPANESPPTRMETTVDVTAVEEGRYSSS